MIIKRIIKDCDLFGKNVELLYHKKKKHKTFFGAFLSLAVISLFFIVSTILYKSYIEHMHPSVLEFEQIISSQKL